MKLIDAEELKNFFYKENDNVNLHIMDLMALYGFTHANNFDEDKMMDFCLKLLQNLSEIVANEIPTAFDKEKVIEELAEEILEYQLGGMPRNNYESGYEDGCEYGFNMAIEIVRRGGIDETYRRRRTKRFLPQRE